MLSVVPLNGLLVLFVLLIHAEQLELTSGLDVVGYIEKDLTIEY